jgi:hypothetical protein
MVNLEDRKFFVKRVLTGLGATAVFFAFEWLFYGSISTIGYSGAIKNMVISLIPILILGVLILTPVYLDRLKISKIIYLMAMVILTFAGVVIIAVAIVPAEVAIDMVALGTGLLGAGVANYMWALISIRDENLF